MTDSGLRSVRVTIDGRPVDAHLILSPAQREARRLARRRSRTVRDRGVRVMAASLRQMGRGRFQQAGDILLTGVGAILVRAIADRLRGGQ